MTFLILGGGSVGRRHIANLKRLGYSSIFCLKRKPDSSFEEHHQVKVVTSIDELEGMRIDAVLVCTPTALHVEGMAVAQKLSAAIFLEKPLTHSLEQLKRAIQVEAARAHTFFIGFMLRYHPLVIKIKQILDTGVLGDVYSARFEFGSYLPYWHPWEDHKTSYAAREDLGGGVVNTITHELDLAQYFFGEPLSVSASTANFSKLGIDVEEIAEVILNYPDKIVSLHLDYLQKDYDRNIKILCDDGKLVWDWHENKVHVLRHKAAPEIVGLPSTFEANNLYVSELQDFIRLVKGKVRRHPLDFTHAVANALTMLTIHESVRQERKIAINAHEYEIS